MTSEEEVVLLREELVAARKELDRSRAECCSAKKLLCKKVDDASTFLQPRLSVPLFHREPRCSNWVLSNVAD